MKEDQFLLPFWCHLCQIQFLSSKSPGVDIIHCPQCSYDFCEVSMQSMHSTHPHPKKFQPFQKNPKKKPKSAPRIDRRIINLSINQLSQIIQVQNERNIEISHQTIQQMRKQVQRPTECVVCKQQMQVGQECLISQCRHVFHEQCLTTWLRMKNSCPTCRQRIIKFQQENKQNNGQQP